MAGKQTAAAPEVPATKVSAQRGRRVPALTMSVLFLAVVNSDRSASREVSIRRKRPGPSAASGVENPLSTIGIALVFAFAAGNILRLVLCGGLVGHHIRRFTLLLTRDVQQLSVQ